MPAGRASAAAAALVDAEEAGDDGYAMVLHHLVAADPDAPQTAAVHAAVCRRARKMATNRVVVSAAYGICWS
ncbi:hypothetical protein ACODT5_00765 [Streptomyces sp. 5.8]|uniref:hypothetical protein n=1 Tax=Streptomyces sp. 5.8 TaxID=3406571 RepID=UPI003BB57679